MPSVVISLISSLFFPLRLLFLVVLVIESRSGTTSRTEQGNDIVNL